MIVLCDVYSIICGDDEIISGNPAEGDAGNNN